MFVYTTQNLKQLPLRTKIGLFLAITLGITLLVLFGLTFLVIALVGGVVTMIVNLFRGGRPQSRPLRDPFPTRRSPFQKPHSPRKMDEDDIIDV
jgi:hypothetical protein